MTSHIEEILRGLYVKLWERLPFYECPLPSKIFPLYLLSFVVATAHSAGGLSSISYI